MNERHVPEFDAAGQLTAVAVVPAHQLAEIVYSVVEARERIFVTNVQGPPTRIRCSCGWSATADEVNLYAAAEEHGLTL